MKNDIELADPIDLARWIPSSSEGCGSQGEWPGLRLAMFTHSAWEGSVPAWCDYMITAFTKPASVLRRLDGGWQEEQFQRGDVTLVPRNQTSEWKWNGDLKNIHLLVSHHYLERIAEEVFAVQKPRITLADQARISDPIIWHAMGQLIREANEPGCGERLYADSIGTQICVQILRNFCDPNAATSEFTTTGTLGRVVASRVADFIDDNLNNSLTLRDLAHHVGISPYHFARRFKAEFGTPPHRFIMARRLAKARDLLQGGHASVKQVAAQCGFYDQSHLAKHFRAEFGTSPTFQASAQK